MQVCRLLDRDLPVLQLLFLVLQHRVAQSQGMPITFIYIIITDACIFQCMRLLVFLHNELLDTPLTTTPLSIFFFYVSTS